MTTSSKMHARNLDKCLADEIVWCICSGLDAVIPGIQSKGPCSELDHSVEKKILVMSDL